MTVLDGEICLLGTGDDQEKSNLGEATWAGDGWFYCSNEKIFYIAFRTNGNIALSEQAWIYKPITCIGLGPRSSWKRVQV